MTLKTGALFAGYGGLDLAIEEAFGAELAWYAEYDAAPSKIMAHHWPDLTNYGDVTAVDWANIPPVDIISGGSPCQDLSLAGARKGMTAGTRSNLWESMREAIATIQPTYVVWENVRGALSAKAVSASDLEPGQGPMGDRDGGHLRALGRVLGDLASLGYDCQWRGLRAADVGAPHGRFRIFVLAKRRAPANTRSYEPERRGITGVLGSATGPRETHREERQRVREATSNSGAGTCGRGKALTNAQGDGRDKGWPESTWQLGRHDATECSPSTLNWGPYAPAIRRWEAVQGTAPSPTEMTAKGKHRLSASFAEWLMGVDPGWITDVPGISRNDMLKAAGNGVVPQQAAAALRDMLAAFEMEKAA